MRIDAHLLFENRVVNPALPAPKKRLAMHAEMNASTMPDGEVRQCHMPKDG